LRSDDGGTVSGRTASRSPNLQQVSSRDEEIAPLIRSIFIPEDGEQWWSLDWSQIEYRVFAHYASGPGADEVRERFQDPDTDFHEMTAGLIQENSGKNLGRKLTKNVSFLSLYGGSAKKLASTAGIAFEDAEQIFESYHEGLPCVRHTYRKAQNVGERRGWIRTYGGRKCRYPLYEPAGFTTEKPLPYQEALEEFGPKIKRANARKALNNLIQGSAADLMKIAMVNLYERGLPVPTLVIHDELTWSLPQGYPVDKIKAVMEDFDLRVPVIADAETGPNWGNLEEVDL
jgi:DNA polymerase-1